MQIRIFLQCLAYILTSLTRTTREQLKRSFLYLVSPLSLKSSCHWQAAGYRAKGTRLLHTMATSSSGHTGPSFIACLFPIRAIRAVPNESQALLLAVTPPLPQKKHTKEAHFRVSSRQLHPAFLSRGWQQRSSNPEGPFSPPWFRPRWAPCCFQAWASLGHTPPSPPPSSSSPGAAPGGCPGEGVVWGGVRPLGTPTGTGGSAAPSGAAQGTLLSHFSQERLGFQGLGKTDLPQHWIASWK